MSVGARFGLNDYPMIIMIPKFYLSLTDTQVINVECYHNIFKRYTEYQYLKCKIYEFY